MKSIVAVKQSFNTIGIKTVIERMAFRVFADTANESGQSGGEPVNNNNNDSGDNGGNSVGVNYEDLIAKARREEKEKQYKNIERLKTQIGTLTEQHNNDLLKIADLEENLQKANEKLTKAGSGDSEEVKTLKETIKTLEGEKTDLDKKVKDFEANKPQSKEEIEKEVRAELEAEYKVKTYKATKLAELKDKLLVPELVMGDTVEDIDKSIEAALARSEEIRKSLGITAPSDKPPKRTPKSPSNPSGGTGAKEVSMEHLATLSPKDPEYAKLRKQLGLR